MVGRTADHQSTSNHCKTKPRHNREIAVVAVAAIVAVALVAVAVAVVNTATIPFCLLVHE